VAVLHYMVLLSTSNIMNRNSSWFSASPTLPAWDGNFHHSYRCHKLPIIDHISACLHISVQEWLDIMVFAPNKSEINSG